MARSRIHPTEQQLGYYRTYRTKHGDVLRMIRMQAAEQSHRDWCDIGIEHRHVEHETPAEFWKALGVGLLLVLAGYALVIALAGYAA